MLLLGLVVNFQYKYLQSPVFPLSWQMVTFKIVVEFLSICSEQSFPANLLKMYNMS